MIANVTALTLPQPDPDEPGFIAALSGCGVEAEVVAWDDPAVDWSRYPLVVLRSTWNYIHKLEAFRAWLTRVSSITKLLNPAADVLWNLDKRYLRELASDGLAVVPTRWVEREDARSSAELLDGLVDVVIKPVVSAGSFSTDRFKLEGAERERAIAFLDQQRAARAMMIQPYQPSIDSWGERSLVFIDGAFTHAMRKSPRFLGGPVVVEGPVEAAADELELATRLMRRFSGRLLYARVDLVRDNDGQPQLMELEITEPWLMLSRYPAADAAMAAAIARRL
jgi:hypothetical protein